MEKLPPGGTRHGPIGADYVMVKSKHCRDRHGKAMAASRNQHNLNAAIMCAPHGLEIGGWQLILGIEQGAVNINGKQSHE